MNLEPKQKRIPKVKTKKPKRIRTLWEILRSEKCLCKWYKLKYQSLCDDCNHKLPNHIKFELWRPMADGFTDVYRDAIEFLTGVGVKLEPVDFSDVEGLDTDSVVY